jgi:uncharacterized damage-inducible protein DinB
MQVGELFLREWEREGPFTKKMLEKVPQDKFGWKPHEKSKTLGALALHVAALPGRWIRVLDSDVFDPTIIKQPTAEDMDAIIKLFEDNNTILIDRFKNTGEEEYDKQFTFNPAGKPLFTTSKAMGIGTFLFGHLIHHRAQLSVYLRLLDVPVPGMYGASADE